MNLFHRLSIAWRIQFLTLLAVASTALIAAVSMSQLHAALHDDVTIKTRQVVDAAVSVIANYEAQANAGVYAPEEAKKLALEAIQAMRYNGQDYFWVMDMYPTMLMHPFKPELNGKELRSFKDPNGKTFFIEMAKAVAKNGEGMVDYMWPKPGMNNTVPMPKVSYVKGFPAWGWIVGSGVYVDEVDAFVEQQSKKLMWLGGAASCVVLLIASLVASGIRRPIRAIQSAMKELAQGNTNVLIPGLGRGDEIGGMAESVNVFHEQALRLRHAEALARTAEETARTERRTKILAMATDFQSGVENILQEVLQSAINTEKAAQNLNQRMESAARNLSQSVQDITSLIDASGTTVKQATNFGKNINASMEKLLSQTQRIHQVTEFINSVAGQINMLALNATIESARAGEAGKGFAVVASEVKVLATQTSKASEDIALQIKDILSSSHEVEEQISNIVSTITQMDSQRAGAASLIENQSVATDEITISSRSTDDILRMAATLAEQAAQVQSEVMHFLTAVRNG